MVTKPVTIWWTPGEPEEDLHGFVTKQDRDDCAIGKSGPFLRIVRNYHELGPFLLEVRLTRWVLDKSRKGI